MYKKIKEAFRIAECIDNARWKTPSGSLSLVNYAHKPDDIEDAEEKAEYIILSHWLTYICERQMSFEQIWDNGGFVFSDMVKKFQDPKVDINDAFIKDFVNIYQDDKGKNKIRFVSKATCGDNLKESPQNELNDNKVYFASRYPSTDAVSVFQTLKTLKDFQKGDRTGLYNYINNGDNKSTMLKLLFCMYDLSYNGIGQPKFNDITTKVNQNEIKINGKSILEYNRNNRIGDVDTYKKDKIFASKRAICALRDYFKGAEYKEHFKILLGKNAFDNLTKQLDQLELPGDVWNNNSRFGKCMQALGFDYGEVKTKQYLNRALRTAYDNIGDKKVGYPEQFDFTFDFVPRMCEKSNCDICLFAYLKKKDFKQDAFNKYCTGNGDKVCPVLLQYCGYTVICQDANDNGACLSTLLQEIKKRI